MRNELAVYRSRRTSLPETYIRRTALGYDNDKSPKRNRACTADLNRNPRLIELLKQKQVWIESGRAFFSKKHKNVNPKNGYLVAVFRGKVGGGAPVIINSTLRKASEEVMIERGKI